MWEFEFLYKNYYKDIFLYILKMMNFNYDITEELTQETFYQLYLSLSRFKGNCDIKTWICSIAKNVCYKYYRKNQKIWSMEYGDALDRNHINFSKTPYELLELKEDAAHIKREILKFRKKYRDVLYYRLYYELSFEEIGKIMKINENSAKVLYHRGRKQLITRLEESKNEK